MAALTGPHGQDQPSHTKESSNAPEPSPEPYSIYTVKEKWFLVSLVALAGLFSPLPAKIYFPAIPELAVVFDQSVGNINLTVTVYLAMQGISPMLWGPLSDRFGRRPIFIVCLGVLVGSCIGLALCPTSAFWLLLLLRALQAGGCASTIALGAGVTGDICTREERGGFFGMFNLGPMLAPCIGPAIGGLLAANLGWRSIFWFLVIFAAVCLFLVVCFLPETLRALVGNGSLGPPTVLHRTLVPVFRTGTRSRATKSGDLSDERKLSTNPFKLFIYADILITLFYTGVVYAINYTITATISSSFADVYPFLSQTSLGLCYLATGAGMIFGSTITGKMLDWDYKRVRSRWEAKQNESDGETDTSFPIELARLRQMPFHLIIFTGCVLAWGWCLDKKVSIAVPLILQVALGYTSISILNATMTLMIDALPAQSSGVIACTNLVRCSLAAFLVSVIDIATQSLGRGWIYVLMGGISILLLPLMYVEIRWGPKWRNARNTKLGTYDED